MGNCCSCCCCAKKDAVVSNDSANGGGMTKRLIEEHSPVFNAIPVPAESSSAPEEKNYGSTLPVQLDFPAQETSDDATSKKHKSVSSTTTNELRIFLPHIDDAHDKSWITPDVIRSYRDSLQLVTLEALNGNSTPEPNHEDKYVIGTSNFAVKFKSGKTMELNVRNTTTPIWMEKWIKTKFGKKDLHEYKPDILTHLSEAGYSTENQTNAAHIDRPQYLSVIKSRNAWKVKSVAIEVVEISVPARTENCTDDVKRKKWLSIALQGEPKDIEDFILHGHAAKDLWKCFTIAKRIYAHNPSQALASHFVPVVSGYPTWLRLCANLVEQQEVEREINPSTEALLHFLK